MLETFWNFDNEFRIVHVVFRQIAVAQIDAALVIGAVGRHVIRADQVIDALAGPAHGSDDIVARLQFSDIRADSFDLTKTFVANHKKVISWRRGTVLGSIDLFVGTIYTDA